MRPISRLVGVYLACACSAGCVQDHVYPGFYGEPKSDENAVMAALPRAGASAGLTMAESPSAVGRAGAAAPNTTGGAADMEPGSTANTAAGASAAAGTSAALPIPDDSARDACDLSGRWLATLHYVTDAIGQQQTIHSFVYYEIEKQGDAYAITKGLHCGDEALAEGLFAITGDFRGTWAAATGKLSYVGRALSSTPSAAGCEVHFEKWYTVRGATYPYYTDPSIALPTVDEPASGMTAGWEDWDGDGQPGITGLISGTVTGKVFVSPRTWTELSGSVSALGDRFVIPLLWDQEYNMLSYDGTPLLASEAVRAADPSLHFAELARIPQGEATGDDLSICNAVVELASMLTPSASAI